MSLAKKSDVFEAVEDHARSIAADLLAEWLPDGVQKGREWVALSPVRDDRNRGSFKFNTTTFKWRDWAADESAKGGGLISLYAYLHLGGNDHDTRTKAMLELGKRFGLIDGTASSAKVIPLRRQPPQEKPKGDDWKSIVPPPASAGKPDMPGFDHIHTYRNGDGEPLRYVGRKEARNGDRKLFIPFTYGVLNGVEGWHKKHPDAPMCLYGLDRAATRPDAPLLFLEGELKSDLVQAVLGDDWVVLSWSGGSERAADHDYAVAAGRHAFVCGDADDGGRKAMMTVAGILGGTAASVHTVDAGEQAKGWDLGQAVKDGWDRGRIEDFISERAHLEPPDLGESAEWDNADHDDGPGPSRISDRLTRGPVALGFDAGTYFYLSPMTGQIEALARRSHTKQELIGIASLEYFNSLEQFRDEEEGKLDWSAIGNDLKNQCHEKGPFNPDIVRGRGAWIDDGRSVLHLGEMLVVNGRVQDELSLPNSRYVYERKLTVNQTVAPPIGTADAHKLLGICNSLNWERTIFGTLFAGWLVVAPICGALKWRPAIWLTGGTGTGKTTLFSNIVEPILGEMHLAMAGGSTEAGIRQKLKSDALPIVFDEAEAEHSHGKQRIQNVLELVRQSTSEGGAAIVKGTQAQTGAKTFNLRSCFMFLSINVSLHHAADENRITVLSLESRKQNQADYDALMSLISATITPAYCAGFLARSVKLIPTIRRNAETFKRAVAAHLGSARIGDQIGTLLAGAYALHSDREITLDEARDYVARQSGKMPPRIPRRTRTSSCPT